MAHFCIVASPIFLVHESCQSKTFSWGRVLAFVFLTDNHDVYDLIRAAEHAKEILDAAGIKRHTIGFALDESYIQAVHFDGSGCIQSSRERWDTSLLASIISHVGGADMYTFGYEPTLVSDRRPVIVQDPLGLTIRNIKTFYNPTLPNDLLDDLPDHVDVRITSQQTSSGPGTNLWLSESSCFGVAEATLPCEVLHPQSARSISFPYPLQLILNWRESERPSSGSILEQIQGPGIPYLIAYGDLAKLSDGARCALEAHIPPAEGFQSIDRVLEAVVTSATKGTLSSLTDPREFLLCLDSTLQGENLASL